MFYKGLRVTEEFMDRLDEITREIDRKYPYKTPKISASKCQSRDIIESRNQPMKGTTMKAKDLNQAAEEIDAGTKPIKEKTAKEPKPKKEPAPKLATFYRYLKDPAEGAKFPPQARIVLTHIRNANEVEFQSLVASVEADPTFKTTQGAAAVIRFYKTQFVNAGIIEVIKK